MTLIYTCVTMVALLGISSLAVDFGRVQLVKTQLRDAADAAARYGAMGLATSNSTAISNAVAAGSQNSVNGSTLSVLTSDVVLGKWSTSTGFTATTTNPNAVQVTAYQVAARGTAVPLLFAQVVGQSTCDVKAVSIAVYTAPNPSYGFVGTGSINASSGMTVDSYNPSSGYSAGSAGTSVLMGSNGNVNLNGPLTLNGSLSSYGGGSSNWLTKNGAVTIAGTTSTLSSQLSYPAASAGSAATTNNNGIMPASFYNGGNVNVTSGTYDVPSGTYYLQSLSISSGATLICEGAVKLYVNGNITISGASIQASLPSDCNIYNVSSAGVNLTNSTVQAEIYASQSPFNCNGSQLYGSGIFTSMSISGTSGLHYDGSLGSAAGGNGVVSIVK